MNSFPCAYYVDADGDNKKDLLVTPNSFGSENYKSVWLYRNASSTNTVNFQFVKNNFLQDEMIEVGQNSFPVLFDYDSDGKKDLLIGNYGYYSGTTLSARLTLYKNIGSLTRPTFSLISRDYGNLSSYILSNSLPVNDAMPAVGDIDGDKDIDILIGSSSGQVHWLENTGGYNQVSNFSVFKENPFTFTTTSGAAAPQLFDLDGDSLLDLLIGMQNGSISWYKNIGTRSTPSFSLITDFLGGIDVRIDMDPYVYDGYAVPFFYREFGVTKLLVGTFRGTIFQYRVPTYVTNTYTLITESVNGYNEGGQSAVWFEDINSDGKADLFIGNSGGGLTFCSSKSQYVGVEEYTEEKIESHVLLFPNPNNGQFQLKTDLIDFQKEIVIINDVLGREVFRSDVASNNETLDISDLNPGIYFATIFITTSGQNYLVTKKILKN
jgi:hypothetical protein